MDDDISQYMDSADDDKIAIGGVEMSRRATMRIGIAILVVLVVLLVFVMWRRRYHSKPDCSRYAGDAGQMCKDVTAVCQGDSACLNAAAHCLPMAAKLGQTNDAASAVDALSGFSQRQLLDCTQAIARVDPARVTAISSACLPAQMAAAAKMMPPAEAARAYNTMANLVNAGRPLAPWALKVAQGLPTCAQQQATP